MIGYALEVTVWNGGMDSRQTAILTLDVDTGTPMLDLRIAGNDDIIINVDPADAYRAISDLDTAASDWQITRRKEEAPA